MFDFSFLYIILSCICCLFVISSEFYGERVGDTKKRVIMNTLILLIFIGDVAIGFILPYAFPVLQLIGA